MGASKLLIVSIVISLLFVGVCADAEIQEEVVVEHEDPDSRLKLELEQLRFEISALGQCGRQFESIFFKARFFWCSSLVTIVWNVHMKVDFFPSHCLLVFRGNFLSLLSCIVKVSFLPLYFCYYYRFDFILRGTSLPWISLIVFSMIIFLIYVFVKWYLRKVWSLFLCD